MKFASLGSGSSGNATLVEAGGTLLLLDCGFPVKEVERRMARIALTPSDLSAIIVTHEHQDHAKGVGPLARKYKLPVYMTSGTVASRDFGKLAGLRLVHQYAPFSIGEIDIQPVVVPHDAKEPAQFVFQSKKGYKLGVLTDLGSITPHVQEVFADCHGLLIEANHDLDMLANGPYPPSLKTRVASAWGHLNNRQTAQFLADYNLDGLRALVVGHISQKNNSLDCVRTALKPVLDKTRAIQFACQDEGFDWLDLSH